MGVYSFWMVAIITVAVSGHASVYLAESTSCFSTLGSPGNHRTWPLCACTGTQAQ